MGYEITLIIGRSGHESDEIARDKDLKYSDGSGHPYKKDDNGELVKTGRKECYSMVMATIEMCKLGYQDDPLNDLIKESFDLAKRNDNTSHYFYLGDGNSELREDRYGAAMWPMPIANVHAALVKTMAGAEPYRRHAWAEALLGAMKNDSEGLQVMFFGH